MLGVGIFGAGRVSGGHPGLKLIGVVEPDEERRSRFTQRHECEGFASHRDMLERDDIDLILVGLPHWLHAPLSIDALNAGKHVMVEKPMACTLEECDAMIDAADRNGVRLMVGHTQQFFAVNRLFKGMIERGELGEIVLAHQTWFKPFGIESRPPWFLDREKGGGMWLMNGAHMVDLLVWLIQSRPVSVKGKVTNRIYQQKADDSTSAIIEFENGVYATIAHSGFKPTGAGHGEELSTELVGTEAVVKMLSYQNKGFRMVGGAYEPVEVPERSGIVEEVGAFVDAIQNDAPSPISNDHARIVMEALLAVEESSRTGREVRLD